MTSSTDEKSLSNKSHILALFASAVFITLFLFFLDEGYNNFKWMTKLGNWIPFMVYVTAIFSSQVLVSRFILRRYNGSGKTLFSIFGGAVIGIMVLVFGIFTNW